MIDPDTIKVIAAIAAASYTALVKIIDVRNKKKAQHRNTNHGGRDADIYTELSENIDSLEELIELPEGLDIPDELRDIVLQRNYYRVRTQYLEGRCRGLQSQLRKEEHYHESIPVTKVANSIGSSDSESIGFQPDLADRT